MKFLFLALIPLLAHSADDPLSAFLKKIFVPQTKKASGKRSATKRVNTEQNFEMKAGKSGTKIKFVKYDPKAANAKCLPELKTDPVSIINSSGVCVWDVRKVPMPPEQRDEKKYVEAVAAATRKACATENSDRPLPPAPVTEAAARVLGTISGIGNGKFTEQHGGVFAFFENNERFSYYDGYNILHINAGNQSNQAVENNKFGGGNNTAMLAHELAHYIFSKGEAPLAEAYQKEVPKPCLLSGYSSYDRDEEVAEVFSSFVTNPDLLQNKGESCDQARLYMAKLFGEDPSKSLSCESRRNSAPAKAESTTAEPETETPAI